MTLIASDRALLRHIVARGSGNVISEQQDYLFESRLAPLAAAVGLESLVELVWLLRNDEGSSLHTLVVEAMMIHETSFFRDVHPFEALRKTVLPALVSRRSAEKRLNIWCAGCSSGQEPYSIAMTIRDGFPQLNGWRVPIMATDLSSSMLDQCRLGRYSKLEVSRGLSDAMLDKHFDWTGTDWFVKPELRQMVDFKRINLAESWPRMPLFDIVFMRNVLVYFDKIKKQEILTRMARVMRPDGYLFLGGGEILINLDTPFTRHEIDDTICYRPDRGGSTLCRVSP